ARVRLPRVGERLDGFDHPRVLEGGADGGAGVAFGDDHLGRPGTGPGKIIRLGVAHPGQERFDEDPRPADEKSQGGDHYEEGDDVLAPLGLPPALAPTLAGAGWRACVSV